MKTFTKLFVGAAMLGSSAANAHYLWIESSESGARLYYGEPDVQLKEKSPGKLDRIKAPQAFVETVAGKPVSAAIDKTAGHFAIGSTASAILVREESVEVADLSKHGLGIAKSNYYARHGQAQQASLALDLQQDGNDRNAYVLLYRGQPLAKAKLEVIAPNTWIQEHTTDAQGRVRINTPWRGQYVVHALHIDKTPGEFEGKQYDNLRNHFTYTFMKSDGADPGPAVAPAHPME